MCQTDESCTFQNGGMQGEHALLGKGHCGINTEWGLGSRRIFGQWFWREHCWFWGEFVHVDLKADLGDSDNNIFIFIIGIRATSRIELFYTVFGQFPLCCCDRERYMIWLYGLFIWQIHIASFLKMYMFKKKKRKQQCVYRSRVRHFVASWMS